MKTTAAVILAAGKGTRMKSDRPKVLAEVLFRPMIQYVIDACKRAGISDLCVVTGYRGDEVEAALAGQEGVCFARQQAQLGTGDAVRAALPFLEKHREDTVAILCGDTPCVDAGILTASLAEHRENGRDLTLLTAVLEDPANYGRILRSGDRLCGIVEAKDCTPEQRAIREINTGIYWFEGRVLPKLLAGLSNENAQHEYYLTDTVAHAQYIATTPRGRKLNLLTPLFHHLIELYSATHRYFDFGTSNEEGGLVLNAGLLRQKSSYGATATIYSRYLLTL